jgi:hypothetical protein
MALGVLDQAAGVPLSTPSRNTPLPWRFAFHPKYLPMLEHEFPGGLFRLPQKSTKYMQIFQARICNSAD